MRQAVIIAAGSVGTINAEGADFVIAADGGYDAAIEQKITPNLYVGDGDSVKCGDILCERVLLNTDKDFTDTECAVTEAIKRGFDKIIIYGATGTRLDHTLASIFMLKKYRDCDIRIVDSNNEIRLITKKTVLCGYIGKTVSFIPADSVISGLTLEGFKYPLYKKDVNMGTTLTVSNVVTDEGATVEAESGELLMITAKD